MEAILTHENADFDAVASQLGAHKLFPEAVPVLPRRLNRNVRNFLDEFGAQLPFVEAKTMGGSALTRVIIVDTQHVQTVRGMSKKTAVEVIDHHESKDPPKQGWQVTTELVGATATLLVERLNDWRILVRPIEATLLLLGIYEDTGQLSFGTTTPRDALAAAWLLEQGANLDTVRGYLRTPLTDAQLQLYNSLLANVELVTAGKKPIVLAAVSTEKPVEEISSVVHRLRDALDPSAIFVLVECQSTIQIVARSSTDQIDVGAIAAHLGGGGHRRASAAIVQSPTLSEVREDLIRQLQHLSEPDDHIVADVMSRGVRTMAQTASARDAESQMQRYGFEGFPVLDEGRIVGLITRRAVDRAIGHKMDKVSVSQIMDAGNVSVSAGDPISTVRSVMKASGWGQIPVVNPGGEVVGVVTRTDLIKYADGEIARTWNHGHIDQALRTMLPQVLYAISVEAGQMASHQSSTLFVVGGVARDLVLGYPIDDIDYVVEGDALTLTRSMAKKFGGKVTVHERFGTGKWVLNSSVWMSLGEKLNVDLVHGEPLPNSIDFVTARTEFYAAPTRLPEVEQSSIKHDLHRRDFTINTLAISLDPENFGALLDYYGGIGDIGQKLIRVLHSLSFVDDPTRILRAVRLERRLGFRIESRTEALISAALPLLDHVSGDRLRHELEAILEEQHPEESLARLDELSVLPSLSQNLFWSTELAEGFDRIRASVSAPLWETLRDIDLTLPYFGLWMYSLEEATVHAVCKRLRVKRRTAVTIEQIIRARDGMSQLAVGASPSEIDRLLSDCDDNALLVLWAASSNEMARSQILDYACRLRYIAPRTTGKTLLERGLEPGSRYKLILGELRTARLNGAVKTDKEEDMLLGRLLNQPENEEA